MKNINAVNPLTNVKRRVKKITPATSKPKFSKGGTKNRTRCDKGSAMPL
ncbi:MAG: hypothetical protein SCH70_07600 [Candidatus Methanoperedens sp.]|nr:hypothetical protein [Candidatus Methanoperedens sp.]